MTDPTLHDDEAGSVRSTVQPPATPMRADYIRVGDALAAAARRLRTAQRAYLDDRGNEAKGRAVAMAAGDLDFQLAAWERLRG